MNHILTKSVLPNEAIISALLTISLFSAGYIVGDIVGSYFKTRRQTEKIDILVAEVAALRTLVEGYYSIEQELEEEQEQELEQKEDLEQDLEQKEEEQKEEEPTHEEGSIVKNHNDEKHEQLLNKLAEGTEVHITYKKETSTALFIKDTAGPNGYWLRHKSDNYNTPSHFSTYIKKLLNPTIQSDNGWDSLYVIKGTKENGKPIKCTLNTLITDA